jgi:hypothetical protein
LFAAQAATFPFFACTLTFTNGLTAAAPLFVAAPVAIAAVEIPFANFETLV